MTSCAVNFPSFAPPPAWSPSFPISWGYHFLPADFNADEASGNNYRVGNHGGAATPLSLLLRNSWGIWEVLASKFFILRWAGTAESTRSMDAWPAAYKYSIKRRQCNDGNLIQKDHHDKAASMIAFGEAHYQNRNFKKAIEPYEVGLAIHERGVRRKPCGRQLHDRSMLFRIGEVSECVGLVLARVKD